MSKTIILIIMSLVFLGLGYLFLAANNQPAMMIDIDKEKLIEIFEELDHGVNQGRGYSEYLNTDGFPTGALLAWSESYLMQGYVNMYKATGDVKYLDRLDEHIKRILANRDDKIGLKDYKNELVPAWGTDRYTRDRAWMHFVAHTGMITYPMLEFVLVVREMNLEEHFTATNDVLYQVEEAVNYHNKDWRGVYYVYPEDFYKADYIVPVSQQAAIGRSLILLYKLTGKNEYLNKVKNLAEFIKNKAIEEDKASEKYLLRDAFIPDKTTPEDRIVDVSHATITIHFAYLAYKNDIVFDEEDMQKFTRTIKGLAQADDNHFPKSLDGSGNFDYEVTAGQYVFLAEFDNTIYDSIIDLFFNHLRIDQTAKYMQEDWWGTAMLGLSRLILYKSDFK